MSMEIVPNPRVGGVIVISTIDVYDSPQECIFHPQKVEGLDAFSFFFRQTRRDSP